MQAARSKFGERLPALIAEGTLDALAVSAGALAEGSHGMVSSAVLGALALLKGALGMSPGRKE